MKPRSPDLTTFPDLQPGDVLLYGGRGFIDQAIQFRTWSDVSHVEIYAGICMSIASRNGIGVGRYLFRADGLRYVLRPIAFTQQQFAQGMAWFATVNRQPYNWGDLLRFYCIDVRTKGFICSQFAAAFFAAAKAPLFSMDYFTGDVCPSDFLTSCLLYRAWSWKQSGSGGVSARTPGPQASATGTGGTVPPIPPTAS